MPKVGRPLSTEQTRLLITLVGVLSNRGDAVVMSAIIARLGLSEDEARAAIDALVDLGAISPSFSVAELDGTEGVSIPATMESHGKVLRLTPSETVAIDRALRRLGAYDDDPLRTSILEALASPSVSDEDLSQVAAQMSNPDVAHKVMQCSQALFYGSGLRFLYQGTSDEAPRQRAAMPISLKEEEGLWYLEAADAESGAHRSFRLDRMDGIAEDPDVRVPAPREESAREVELLFADTSMLELLEWPRLQLLGDPRETPVRARIPYYGGLWLVRRLAACGSGVTVCDSDLAAAVADYARRELEQA